MKKIMLAILVIVVLGIGGFIWMNGAKKDKIDPIDEIISSYKNYEFHDIKTYQKGEDIFNITEDIINYDKTSETLQIELDNNELFTVRLIDDILHIVYKDIDYKYEKIGEIDRLMNFKSCNCNDLCIKIIALNEEGKVYYIDLYDSLDKLDDENLFKLIDIDFTFTNVGYINNLLKPNTCGENGIALTTYDNQTIILDSQLNYFNQDYYTYIGDENQALYVYPDGTIKIYIDDIAKEIDDINVTEAFKSDENYYVVDNNGYLYEIDNMNIKKISNSKVVKIGYRTREENVDSAIIIYEDASAKTYKVDTDSKPLK